MGRNDEVKDGHGNDSPRLSDAALRRRREPMTVDPNQLADEPQYSRDSWYWDQVESKR